MPRGTPPKRRSSNPGTIENGRPTFGSIFRAQDLLRVRTIALLTLICLALYTLLKSLDGASIAREPFQVIDHFSNKLGSSAGRTTASPDTPRIKKLSAVMGDRNDIYEAALRTHERHNAVHGYEMEVLRERIIGSYWEKPAYLLSKVVEEMAKPAATRTHWLMWCDPDTIILNPQIPLDIFLPPPDQNKTMFVASHDDRGMNGGVFFVKVDEMSITFLIESLALVRLYPKLDLGIEKSRTAMQTVLSDIGFRDRVVFMPRWWFNGFEMRRRGFEGPKGSMLVHFHGLEGDKWPLMTRYLRRVRGRKNPYEMAFDATPYAQEIEPFWERIREAKALLAETKGRKEDIIRTLAGRLYHSLSFETDQERTFISQLDKLGDKLKKEKM